MSGLKVMGFWAMTPKAVSRKAMSSVLFILENVVVSGRKGTNFFEDVTCL